jgi:hypothetical protein
MEDFHAIRGIWGQINNSVKGEERIAPRIPIEDPADLRLFLFCGVEKIKFLQAG